jgi:hypothetical protein
MARTSIILGGIALVLLAFIVFFERDTLSTRELEGRKGRILEAFVRERVTRIDLQRKGVTTTLTRSEFDPDNPLETGGWNVEQPYAAKAERETVEALTGALEWINPRRSLGKASAEDRARFGLDKPRYRLAFVAGRERRSFVIGADSSDGSGTYLLTPEDGLAYVVGSDLVEALDHEPGDFHTKELHDGLSMLTVEQLSVQSAQGERALVKRDGLYWLTKPAEMLASDATLTELVHVLDGLRASRFVAAKPGKLADYGLDAPRLAVRVDSREFDPQASPKGKDEDKPKLAHFELRAGGACADHAEESYIRVGEGALSCIKNEDLSKIENAAADLRERRLLAVDDSQIRSVELRVGKQQLSIEEHGEHGAEHEYRLLEGGREVRKGKVDEGALSSWYKSLRDAKAAEFEPSSAGGAADASSISLTFGRGKDLKAYTLQLAKSGKRVAARRAGEKYLAYYPESVLELVSVSAARFRKPQILSEDDGKLTKLSVTAAGREDETVSKIDGRYVLTAGGRGPELAKLSGVEPERPSVDEIARLVSKLEALRFVADAPRPEHGLSQPAYTLRAEYAGGVSHVLKLGAASEDGRYAQVDADPNVFVVAQALVRQLESPLLSKSALSSPLEDIKSFEIEEGGKRLRVEAKPLGGFALAGSDRPADDQRAENLAHALAAVRATRVTSYGKPASEEPIEPAQLRIQITTRKEAGAEQTRSVTFGPAPSAEPDAEIFARASDLPATFALPNGALDPLRIGDKVDRDSTAAN